MADMKRLFCESRIHGSRRWWIRVFLYHADWGTLNSMVLFRQSYLANKNKPEAKNLRDFKMIWLQQYCGERIRSIPESILGQLPRCHIVTMTKRNRCAWCMNVHNSRNDTSLACKFCCAGTGPIYFCNPAVRPCFFLGHKSEDTRTYLISCEQSLRKKRKRSVIVTPPRMVIGKQVANQSRLRLSQHFV